MFAKLINETTIEKAPRCIHVGATTFVIPDAAQYAAGGYYEVIESEKPEARKWYDLVPQYTLVDAGEGTYSITQSVVDDNENESKITETYTVELKQIVQSWQYEKVPQPDYGELIVGYIRERYSINDELALQRQWDNGPAKKEEFLEYNDYCDECKVQARADLAEWEAA